MKVLWLAWKDKNHPAAGGAEVVLHELSAKLIEAGHEVTVLTCRYPGSATTEVLDGVNIIRVGSNRYTHSFAALAYYMRHLRNRFDVVIETVNTAPYFAALFRNKGQKPFLFYHQLAREIWYYEMPSPFSHLGYYIIEPLSTFLLGKSRSQAITISDSTKKDLQRFGFKPDRVHIISQVNHMPPLADISKIKKFEQPTLLSLGAAREMKRTIDQVKAFEIAKKKIPALQMKIAGSTDSAYGKQLLGYVVKSPYKKDIEVLNWVTYEKKIELMQRSHLIGVSSVKEGWGLIVTEAAGQGTPAVVYDVDGLRDSVQHLKTGIITVPNPVALAEGITQALQDSTLYDNLRRSGWQWSKQFTLNRSYREFFNLLEK